MAKRVFLGHHALSVRDQLPGLGICHTDSSPKPAVSYHAMTDSMPELDKSHHVIINGFSYLELHIRIPKWKKSGIIGKKD
jgi:hypothetical protein